MTSDTGCSDEAFNAYKPWFYAAALYNLVWGAINIISPHALFDILGIDRPNYTPLWQVIGMFVLVYAPGYWWTARRPAAHRTSS